MKHIRAACWAMVFVGLVLMALGMQRATDGLTGDAEDVLTAAVESGELLRLHIVADDDSTEAQRVKLCVRDAFIAQYSQQLAQLEGSDAAMEFLRGELGNIQATAMRTLEEQGAAYGARAMLGECDFPDREYGGTVVPAGRYRTLRIELGRAQGRNWWCVVYPALCTPGPDVPTEGERIMLRSALWDWLRGVCGF